MPKKTANRYFVRNRLHQTIGDFSEDEIISLIRKGKFSGDEEAALYPTLQWNRLSSFPVFYDVLVNRALGLQSPQTSKGDSSNPLGSNQEKPSVSALKEQSDKTEGREKTSADPRSDQNDATAQLVPPSHVSEKISNSEIAELFSEVKEPLNQPIADLGGPSRDTEKPPSGFDRRTDRKKKFILWGSVAGLLFILFQSGGKNLQSKSDEADKPSANGSPELVSAAPEDSQTFFIRSADQALSNDSTPGYLLAADFYKKAIEIRPSDLELYDGLTTALARFIESNPSDTTKDGAFERYLKQGRTLEPQRTAFFRAEAIVARARGDAKKSEELLGLALETDSLNPENLLVQAEWMVKEERFSEVIPLLKSLVKLNPENIRGNYLLAVSLFREGNSEQAWNLAQQVTQLNPAHAASYSLIGDILSQKNELKAAKAIYLLSCKFAPLAAKETAAYAFWRAGNLYELGGEEAETRRFYVLAYGSGGGYGQQALEKLKNQPSQEELKKAQLETYADGSYYDRLGTEAMEEKKFERAQGFYLAGTLVFPSSGKLWMNLGAAREASARTRDEFRWAAMTYEKAIQVDSDQIEALIKLGLLETEQSNWARAFQSLQKAEELAPEDPTVQLALGKHFFARKDFRQAMERLRSARRTNPNLAEVSYYQGLLYKIFDPGNPKAAIRHFEEAYSKDPGNYEALAEWLKLKVVTFEKMFAVKFLRNMVAADPQNPMLFWVLGEVYSENKEFNRALNYYRKALDLDKKSSKVRLSMARALASLGRIDEAVSEYKLASDLDAKNGEGYFYAAELLYQTKNYALARDLLQGLLKIIPNYPGARKLLAMNYQALNQVDDAIREMNLEVRANPMNYQFAIELAQLYMVNNKFLEATKELDSITNLPIEKLVTDERAPSGQKKEPTGLKSYKIRALLLLSQCYRQLKRFEPADGAIQAALALDPDNVDLKLERGFVFQSLGRYTEASKDFNEFLNKNPNSPEAPAVREILRTTVIEE